MSIYTKRIERPRSIRELRHALRYGRYVDGTLEYHHDETAKEPGDLSTWTLSVETDDNENVLVRRINHYIHSKNSDGSSSIRTERLDPIFKGSLKEFLATDYADTFCERFKSSLVDLSDLDDVSNTVGSDDNGVWIQDTPIKCVTRDWGNNPRFQRMCDLSVVVNGDEGEIALSAYDGWRDYHEVYGLDVEQFIELIEIAKLIKTRKLDVATNGNEIELRIKTKNATIELSFKDDD